jgi:hypothetical protein
MVGWNVGLLIDDHHNEMVVKMLIKNISREQ